MLLIFQRKNRRLAMSKIFITSKGTGHQNRRFALVLSPVLWALTTGKGTQPPFKNTNSTSSSGTGCVKTLKIGVDEKLSPTND
jgi:hypothetical protein